MKNIGIITFSYTDNVGSALQTFALQRKVKEICNAGFNNSQVDVINYEKRSWIGNYTPSFKHFIANPIEYIFRVLILTRVYFFNSFQRKYIKFSHKSSFKNREELIKLNKRYDCFIAGSDQIWNYSISRVDDSYFLDFVNDANRKIAYAPSLGSDIVPNEYREAVKKHLRRFDYISVREKDSVKLVKDLIGRDAELVLDPTLLFTKESWTDMLSVRKLNIPPFILVYIRDHLPSNVISFAEKLSFLTGFKIIKIHGCQIEKNYLHIVRPEEWLSYIISAEYVVTNSFHAVAFSINFHKCFFVDANQNSSRINSILSLTRLEDRLISNKVVINTSPINFEYADGALVEMRKKSIDYIHNAIFNTKS